jgi:hypothetical protein
VDRVVGNVEHVAAGGPNGELMVQWHCAMNFTNVSMGCAKLALMNC